MKPLKTFLFLSIFCLSFQSCKTKREYASMNDLYLNCNAQVISNAAHIEKLQEKNKTLERQNRNLVELFNQPGDIAHTAYPVMIDTVYSEPILAVDYVSADYVQAQEARADSQKQLVKHVQDSLQSIINNKTTSNYSVSPGKVAFYCPKILTYKKIYDAYGLIADVISDDKVRELLVNNIKEIDEGLDTEAMRDDDILIKQIQYYSMIELSFDEVLNQNFEIEKVHEEDKQVVSDKMEGWHWQIRPMSTEAEQQLILKVKIFKSNGEVDDVFSKKYDFKIEVDSLRFVSEVKELFLNEPKWAMGSIILPFITFLYGRYEKRKKSTKDV